MLEFQSGKFYCDYFESVEYWVEWPRCCWSQQQFTLMELLFHPQFLSFQKAMVWLLKTKYARFSKTLNYSSLHELTWWSDFGRNNRSSNKDGSRRSSSKGSVQERRHPCIVSWNQSLSSHSWRVWKIVSLHYIIDIDSNGISKIRSNEEGLGTIKWHLSPTLSYHTKALFQGHITWKVKSPGTSSHRFLKLLVVTVNTLIL